MMAFRPVLRAVRMVLVCAVLMVLGAALLDLEGIVQALSSTQRVTMEDNGARKHGERLYAQGQQIFRFSTFGDQQFWGGALKLHRAIEGSALGGVGPGLSPEDALAVGLKVDSTALPGSLKKALAAGQVDLDDPSTTLALLKLNAVVGVKGFFNEQGTLKSVGITCGLCHSMVDDSFAPGIGRRLDGWPNRDPDLRAIVSLAPHLDPITSLLGVDEATVKTVLASWGPGKFDAELFLDGKAFQPDGRSAATLIPPAYGMAGVNLHTYTGWGSIPYWNAFVAVLEMHGQGSFYDPRLDNAAKFPIAARNGFGHVTVAKDQVTPKLPALHLYQLSLPAPTPPPGSFDPAAAARGESLFNGKASCSSCHMPPTYTDSGWNLHTPASICTDAFQADRSPDGMYRTTPLRGLLAHAKGGYYHDGRFPDLTAVVDHYDSCFSLGLTAQEKHDLVEFLKSR